MLQIAIVLAASLCVGDGVSRLYLRLWSSLTSALFSYISHLKLSAYKVNT